MSHHPAAALRAAVAALFLVHGLIHLLGFATAFGFADLPELGRSLSEPVGTLWLVAAVLCVASAVALFGWPRWWWAIGALAVVTSQIAIGTSWTDAKWGTAANLLLAVAVLYGVASRGPLSLRAEFERHAAAAWPAAAPRIVTEDDLDPLPEPVRRYLRRSGAVGSPVVHDFRLTWSGRIRSGPEADWMTFTAEQINTWDVPRRFFWMSARMKGLPVDVLHVFDEDGATMRVRLLSVRSMVNARGPELTRAETVTVFNDLCVYAPGALTSATVLWRAIDDHHAAGRFTLGDNTIDAELTFDDDGDLVDFASDDRAAAAPDGATFTPLRWTTPLHAYAVVGPARVPTTAEAVWHPAEGAWTYGEFTLTSLAYNVARRRVAASERQAVNTAPR